MYLIVGDKYDVYEPFIIDKHPHNPTLDNCPEEPWVINTKPMLQENARKGVKDIFRINDTHWSPIGAKLVADYLKIKYDIPGYNAHSSPKMSYSPGRRMVSPIVAH